ncbi:MAG: hypothetical protein AB8B69_00950, partial [Chitinophagales bacterium]
YVSNEVIIKKLLFHGITVKRIKVFYQKAGENHSRFAATSNPIAAYFPSKNINFAAYTMDKLSIPKIKLIFKHPSTVEVNKSWTVNPWRSIVFLFSTFILIFILEIYEPITITGQ